MHNLGLGRIGSDSDEVAMPNNSVTEEEVESAFLLSEKREFKSSLALFQGMLERECDANTKLRLLFGIVTCSTWLSLDGVREKAIQDLMKLPDFDVSHAFAVLAKAKASLDSGRAKEALGLINENLEGKVLNREDFRDWKYEHLFLKGQSLVELARYDEALSEFDEARTIYPDGELETNMLIERSNCLLALSRYDETYGTASLILARGDEEMATLALQYMAESRMWQARASEALELYVAVQRRLPSRFVQEQRIKIGMKNAIAYLEKHRPYSKPS
jgi:tetratricopeptide (TPR) repeat protein